MGMPVSASNWTPRADGGWDAPGVAQEPARPDVEVRAVAALRTVLKLAELADGFLEEARLCPPTRASS